MAIFDFDPPTGIAQAGLRGTLFYPDPIVIKICFSKKYRFPIFSISKTNVPGLLFISLYKVQGWHYLIQKSADCSHLDVYLRDAKHIHVCVMFLFYLKTLTKTRKTVITHKKENFLK